jgi:hypothetical protein
VLGVDSDLGDGERYFRAIRLCDELLGFLASYRSRDDAIARLELAIMDDRLEALLGARETANEPTMTAV